ncbi:hypothetical protein [Achromobacter animicus]|uniref:hypothetical protein n=1 Tax=Achromobacter animicus TaxID=1389935 RepID=UPI00345E8EDF
MAIRQRSAAFSSRPVFTVQLPLRGEAEQLVPSQTLLKIGDDYFDVGAICYAERAPRKKPRAGREVVVNSYLPMREIPVSKIIDTLCWLSCEGGASEETTSKYARTFFEFVDWADANGFSECLAGSDGTRSAFNSWATFIHERYRQRAIGATTRNSRIHQAGTILERSIGPDNLKSGIARVVVNASVGDGAEVPDIGGLSHALAINQALFDGFCDLVLGKKSFPHKIELPRSLGWESNHLWVFPTNVWGLPPLFREHDARSRSVRGNWVYDYHHGCIANIELLMEKYHGPISKRRRLAELSISRAQNCIDEANADMQGGWRHTFGMVALRAFEFMLLCHSGANNATIRTLNAHWEVERQATNPGFRNIKARAGGKPVIVVVPQALFPRLRRFMELREFLLQGRSTPYLFFSCGNRNNESPRRISSYELAIHFRTLQKRIDPDLKGYGAQALRASAQDHHLHHSGAATSALIMGHSEHTARRHYGRGSSKVHQEQIASFFVQVSKVARKRSNSDDLNASRLHRPLEHGGCCASYGNAKVAIKNPPVTPNCETPGSGCVFCAHRILIADEEDVRKITSAVYVLRQIYEHTQAKNEIESVIVQFEKDLESIAGIQKSRAMVEQISEDVYERENMTPYWTARYQLLLDLGLIL